MADCALALKALLASRSPSAPKPLRPIMAGGRPYDSCQRPQSGMFQGGRINQMQGSLLPVHRSGRVGCVLVLARSPPSAPGSLLGRPSWPWLEMFPRQLSYPKVL